MAMCTNLIDKMRRKKLLQDVMETPLKRCLNTLDLVLLGIGHMVGAGIFVITGTIVKNEAGPGTILSYLFAGIAAGLSALCYAEFGACVPKAGSSYSYSYVTIGEFWAFLMGWNIILEQMVGAASVARSLSGSIDTFFNGAIRNGTIEYIGEINIPFFSSYPDFLSVLTIIIVLGFVASGAKISTTFNNVFTSINLLTIVFIVITGFVIAKPENWTNTDNGGFLPFGVQGIFAGAATCFYSYIGFEGIGVAGEEAKEPAKSIPIATLLSMVIVTVIYMLCSAVLTLMVPYNMVDIYSPFPGAFAANGLPWAQYIAATGALFGLATTLSTSLFVLPRSIYAMSSDGLLFQCLSYVHPKTQTPIISITIFGFLTSLLSLLIDLEQLVQFLSIGTLINFTMVAVNVLILRYQPIEKCQFKLKPDKITDDFPLDSNTKNDFPLIQSHSNIGKLKKRFQQVPLLKNLDPETITSICVAAITVFIACWCCLMTFAYDKLAAATWWTIILLIVVTIAIIGCFCILSLYEKNISFTTFQVRK